MLMFKSEIGRQELALSIGLLGQPNLIIQIKIDGNYLLFVNETKNLQMYIILKCTKG